MRWQAIIVLLVVALAVIVPPSLSIDFHCDALPALGALDVCHSATPALSSNGDMPCLSAAPCQHITTQSITCASLRKPLFTQTLFSSDNERPPQS